MPPKPLSTLKSSSVRFHNDVIISRAANEHTILLWRIEGFDSENPPPTSFPMPHSQTVHSDKAVIAPASFRTRSAWGGRFQRLLQFDLPDSGAQYIRFGLFHELGKHPILSAGNHRSEVFFWDLERLEEYGVSGAQVKGEGKETTAFRMQTAPSALPPDLVTRFREGSEASSTSSASGAHSTTSGGPRGGVPRRSRSVKAKDAKVVGIGNPLKPIKPHKKVIYVTPNVEYTPRQITFSRGGDWCVATGENGVIVIMSRWEDGWPETPGGLG
jgi:polycomb protein EED